MSKMKIGYLHMGPHKHGVCPYGRLLAAKARRRPELTVIEADVILTENRKHIESCWLRRLSGFRRRKLFTGSAI
jgi:hypothetical protein